MSGSERPSQRADKWLWCARFRAQRAECAKLIEGGALRINRQPTDKPHARLRVGDVVTLARGRDVVVAEVLALAERRGSASEAGRLYRELPAPDAQGPRGGAREGARGCGAENSAAYAALTPPAGSV